MVKDYKDHEHDHNYHHHRQPYTDYSLAQRLIIATSRCRGQSRTDRVVMTCMGVVRNVGEVTIRGVWGTFPLQTYSHDANRHR